MSAVIPVSIARVMMGKMMEQTLPAQHSQRGASKQHLISIRMSTSATRSLNSADSRRHSKFV